MQISAKLAYSAKSSTDIEQGCEMKGLLTLEMLKILLNPIPLYTSFDLLILNHHHYLSLF